MTATTQASASIPVLQGHWSAGRGLVLWLREPSTGDALEGAADLAEGTLAPEVEALVRRVPVFRHRIRLSVPALDGSEQHRRVPALCLSPEAAVEYLGRWGFTPPPGVGDDVALLCTVAAAVKDHVQAGRIVPRLFFRDGVWSGMWELAGGASWRSWLSDLWLAAPPVFAANSTPRDLADFIDQITPVWVRVCAGEGAEHERHPVIEALGQGETIPQGTHSAAELLRAWSAGAATNDVDVVVRVHEPVASTDDVADAEASSGSDAGTGVPGPALGSAPPVPESVRAEANMPLGELWCLEPLVRIHGRAPEAIDPTVLDPDTFAVARRRLAEADVDCTVLREAFPGGERGLRWLPTAAVPSLLAAVDELKACGVHLLAPRAWARPRVTARLGGERRDDDATSSGQATRPSRVGVQALQDFDWRIAVGDVLIDEAELRRMVASASELVWLRDQWVLVDRDTVSTALDFVTKRRAVHAERRRVAASRAASAMNAEAADAAERQELDLGEAITGITRELVEAEPPVPVDGVESPAVQRLRHLAEQRSKRVAVENISGLHATLRPYQREGVSWLATMERAGLGAVLADDMGLGKTIQVIALILREQRPGRRTLVVCPLSLLGNWARELATFAPGLRVHVHHGPYRVTVQSRDESFSNADVVLTTYNLLVRDANVLATAPWFRVVFDEAQTVKNIRTAQSRAARAVPAEQRIALTGTPVENRLEELRAVLDLVNPGLVGSPSIFRNRFAIPIERDHDDSAVARLAALSSPFVLRRVKTDPAVISDLPEKIDITMSVELTEEQASLYQAVVDDLAVKLDEADEDSRRGVVLGALTRLKQVCNHPAHYLADGSALVRRGAHRSGKVAALEDLLVAIRQAGEKVLLFTQYTTFAEMLTTYFSRVFDEDIPFLHGALSRGQRDEMVARFAGPDGPSIFVLSLLAGGTGLNLTAANHVIHVDRWWNPAVENQATDRAYRIGQGKDVHVRRLVCSGTVEERIDHLIEDKRELEEFVVSSLLSSASGAASSGQWITEMTDAEILDLVALGTTYEGES